uniref:Uncharacterized protein n=1 Tax=uncultured marine virus TaxID=186617 RepID=A0A0F7LAB5_9VIRU|nr:hypothetical protein [uncultured marine virus]
MRTVASAPWHQARRGPRSGRGSGLSCRPCPGASATVQGQRTSPSPARTMRCGARARGPPSLRLGAVLAPIRAYL